jgi:cystathionine beta-lyase
MGDIGSDLDTPDLHRLTPAQLRARRTMKWTTYPDDVLPMWVAEMDYPLAAPVRRALQDAVEREMTGYQSQLVMREYAEAMVDWQAAQAQPGWL